MKIAVIVPGDLPIPAIKGGAIETLVTYIINENEKAENPLEIHVYNKNNYKMEMNKEKDYKHTKVYFIDCNNIFSKIYMLIYKMIRGITFRLYFPPNFYVFKCIKEIKKNSYDYVIVEGEYLQVLHLKNRTKAKIVLHLHTDLLHRNSLKGNKAVGLCDKILTVSEFIKERVLELNPGKNINVLKNVAELERFDSSLYQNFRTEFRKENNVAEHEVLLLYCGRLSEEKGVKELLLAFNKIKDLPCKLLIVGSSWFSSSEKTQYMHELEKISKWLGERIIFTGYIPHKYVPKYYAIADIAVVPSICNEAASLATIEALSSGLPVIASNMGGITEYAQPSCCEIVQCNSSFIENLESSMKKLILDKKYLNEKKKNARVSVSEFNTTNYYQNFRKIIDQ